MHSTVDQHGAGPVDPRVLAASPLLDKARLVGGCVRLPLPVDGPRLAQEVAALPAGLWGSRGGRVGVHNAAQAIFLRGYAPAEGDKPIEDRPPLDLLPYARELITQRMPAQPLRCLLALLPAGGCIGIHIDRADYFGKTLRFHFPVLTHEHSWMYCEGLFYRMRQGEAWALNNSGLHGVLNLHPQQGRIHMICDFLPSAPLLELLGRGARDLGESQPQLRDTLMQRSAAA